MSASLLTACRLGDHAAAAHCLEQYRPAAAPAASPAERTRISLALNASEASGWSPLLYAARNAWSDIVKSLLEFNTLLDTHAKLNSSGNTGKGARTHSRPPIAHAHKQMNIVNLMAVVCLLLCSLAYSLSSWAC